MFVRTRIDTELLCLSSLVAICHIMLYRMEDLTDMLEQVQTAFPDPVGSLDREWIPS